MKNKLSKACCILLALIFSLSTNQVFADTNNTVSYSIESAVRTGLDRSIIINQLENKVILSKLRYSSYQDLTEELGKGSNDVSKGEADLDNGLNTINANQDILNQAKIDILGEYYPQDFPNPILIPQTPLPGGLTLPALIIKSDHDSNDTDRKTIVEQITEYKSANGALLAGVGISLDPEDAAEEVISNVNSEIAKQQKALDKGKTDYEKNSSYFVNGKIDYEIAKASIAAALSDQLNITELNKLSTVSEKDLMLKMADAATVITVASEGIYKSQIALLIKNSYYNVLKAKKLADVKQSTMKRAEVQYNFAKDSYESGMKAKDDMLLADMYYTGTKLEYQKAQDDYNNFLVELKKNMNISLVENIELEDVSVDENTAMSLEEGLDYGLDNRLEIIKAEKAIEIYKLNKDYVKKSYTAHSDRYSEAGTLEENAEFELEKAQIDVESSIRQSYNTMLTMEAMLDTSRDMVNQARECLTIAEDKYKEGFGADSSLLKKVGMESASGTVLEVISAEENLAQVEEKYIQILYGYNLAKAKYLNDTGYLTY